MFLLSCVVPKPIYGHYMGFGATGLLPPYNLISFIFQRSATCVFVPEEIDVFANVMLSGFPLARNFLRTHILRA